MDVEHGVEGGDLNCANNNKNQHVAAVSPQFAQRASPVVLPLPNKSLQFALRCSPLHHQNNPVCHAFSPPYLLTAFTAENVLPRPREIEKYTK